MNLKKEATEIASSLRTKNNVKIVVSKFNSVTKSIRIEEQVELKSSSITEDDILSITDSVRYGDIVFSKESGDTIKVNKIITKRDPKRDQ